MADFVIIVAGGSGSRMAADKPKQFLLLAGKPLLMHTIAVFHTYSPSLKIILTLPEDHIDYWNKLCLEYSFNIIHTIVQGGQTRFHSVQNALSVIDDESGIVAIHDGVRPLVNQQTIRNCFDIAYKENAVISVVPVFESLRIKNDKGSKPVDREQFLIVQTPQVFKTSVIKEAYLQVYESSFTDDASVVERAGYQIEICEGNRENIKITTASDLLVAKSILSSRS